MFYHHDNNTETLRLFFLLPFKQTFDMNVSNICLNQKVKTIFMKIDSAETHRRLLETAATVFAEYGFASTTVRMICGRAKVNVAAVNYHFGSKEALYREVLRHVRRCAYEKYPPSYGLTLSATPKERLHAFVRSFLLRTLGDEQNRVFGTLTMREMVEPTGALDMIIEEGIRTLFGELVGIVRALLGTDTDVETVETCSRSIIGQCVFYLFGRPVIARMKPEQKFTKEDIEKISGEIVDFSIHALNGIKSCVTKQGKRPS
jgi:AcrR family transcriptional regulator